MVGQLGWMRVVFEAVLAILLVLFREVGGGESLDIDGGSVSHGYVWRMRDGVSN